MVKPVVFEGIPKELRIKHTLSDRETLKNGCKFIRDIGNKIGFPNRTVLTAQWYFKKFYQTRHLNSAPSLDIALTCTILACKVEESYERIKSILVAAFLILNGNSFQGRQQDIKITEDHKNRVVQYERDVLIATTFRFNLSHPHDLLVKLSKSLEISKQTAQKAWDLLNNWYEMEDFVLWEPPHTLALSALNCVLEQSNKTNEHENLMKFIQKNSFKLIK